MVLEIDFANKLIKIKSAISVSDLISKIQEFNLGDYSIISDYNYWHTTPYQPILYDASVQTHDPLVPGSGLKGL